MKNHADASPSSSGRSDDSPPSPLLEWVVTQGRVEQVFDEVETRLGRRRRRRRVGWALAGVAVLLVGVWGWTVRETSTPARIASATVLVPAKHALPDGSVVELKDGAAFSLQFTDTLRRVILERGEGHFHVAKNAERPFVVAAGGVEVRAVGTAFSVQLGAGAVEVLVTEGTVAVDREAGRWSADARPAPEPEPGMPSTLGETPPSGPTLAHKGSRVVIELTPATSIASPLVVALSETEIKDRLSWRVPRLELVGTPLAQAIPMFNEHARVRLVLGDPLLAGLELSGMMRADNVDSLLRLLYDEFGIRAERQDDTIVLRR